MLPTLLALVLIVPAAVALSFPASLVAFFVATDFKGELKDFGRSDGEWVARLSALERLHLLVLPTMAAILVLTVAAGLISREPLRARLGLVRPRGGFGAVPLYALAAPLLGLLGAAVASHFFEPSEHVEALTALITEPHGLAAAYLVLWLSLAPGVVEELLYRGFVQQRLQRRWPAPLAVGVTAVAFALSHIDPMHVAAVLPVAFWLSFVGWGTRSVLPSMICHAFYNAVMMVVARLAPEGDPGSVEWGANALAGGLVLVFLGAFLASVPLLLRAGLRRP